MRILELTDALGAHRDIVTVPLTTKGEGSIALLPDGKLNIACPDNAVFDEWLGYFAHGWKRWTYQSGKTVIDISN
jgi:hypothetical protein